MRVVVTGAAGFIGSRLCESLLERGDQVVGIDALTPYYDPRMKHDNLFELLSSPNFEVVTTDLRTAGLEDLLEGADVIWHQAGQPGVRLSWANGFAEYVGCNVAATQRVLEAAKAVGCPRLVYASSSSVYGNAAVYPTSETHLPRPQSPYGVTKLAAEQLCSLYASNYGLSTVSLRYFTVYGPRQRPDMAFRRLLEATLRREPFDLYGSGEQIRDFTYVDDVVRANLSAGSADVAPGTVCNVAGGSSVSMLDVIRCVGELADDEPIIRAAPFQAGDVNRTGGDITRAGELLGWAPEIDLREGLRRELAWCGRTRRPPLQAVGALGRTA